MYDVRIVKTAYDMDDRIDLADIGEELVSQAFALACTAYKTGDIDEFDDGRCIFLRVIHLGQFVQTAVRDRYDADVRLNGAERIVCGFCACFGDCVKQCALADVWQTNDTQFHEMTSFLFRKDPLFSS